MGVIIQNDLVRFLDKVKNLQKAVSPNKDNMATALAEHGAMIARYEYATSGFMPTISVETTGSGQSDIVFSKEGLAYHEFGTGAYATYPDESKLPKSGVPITGKWEYYYPNPKTKRTIGGQKGWFFGKTFSTGQPAHAEIYYTAKALRKDAPYVIMQGVQKIKRRRVSK